MKERGKIIEHASWVSIIGNTFLASIKIIIGLIAGSLAVIADGIDSMTDILTSFITLITSKILSKPPSIKYAYGYEKADSIATKVLSFVIFFAGIQLGYSSVRKIIMGNVSEMPSILAISVTILSIIGKTYLSIHQTNVGKKVNSPMLIANGKNMQNDILISGAVLVGLIFTHIFKLPVLDGIFALLVSFWILKVALQIFMKTNIDLMDGIEDCEVYDKIFTAIDSIEGVYNPHRVRARKIGPELLIAIDIEVDGTLSLNQAHTLAHDVEKKIKEEIENVFDVTIHVEPLGDKTKEKKLGLTREELKG